MSDRKTKVKT